MYEFGRSEVFFLLRSYAANYPVILEQGYDLPKAILFVVGEGEGKSVMDFLESDLDIRIDGQMRKSRLATLMNEVNSGFILFYFAYAPKDVAFLEGLGAIARSGWFSGAEISAPILVVAEGIPVGVDLHNFFLVFHESSNYGATVQLDDVVPADDALPVVFNKLKEHCHGRAELQAWTAAACFLYPQLKDEESDVLFQRLLRSARRLVRDDENNQEGQESLGEFVVNSFYDWQAKTGFSDIIELPCIGREARLNVRKYIFFDDEYVYLTCSLFDDITRSLQYTYSSIRLKSGMQNEDILCPDHGQTYTSKMSYYNEVLDCFERKRVLRLRRSKLSRLGDLSFVELCVDTKKEHSC